MLLIDNLGVNDPHINLALEEYLLRHVLRDEPMFMSYVNEPSVIVGRNQIVLQEVNLAYVQERGIHVVRRLSGGGTVYHDLGNLNTSVLLPGQEHLHDFAYFASVMIDALLEFGIRAELRNRSSLFVGAQKISGNAQYATSGRLLHHGTMLFDTDLEAMRDAIIPGRLDLESKAVQSVRSDVVNLRSLLGPRVSLDSLRAAISGQVAKREKTAVYTLGAAEWEQVHRLARERYQSWDWNIGRSPRFTLRREVDWGSTTIASSVTVDRGQIIELSFTDMMTLQPAGSFANVASALIGAQYRRADVQTLVGEAIRVNSPPFLTEQLVLALVI